jgi:hypothetical protein
MLNLLLVAHNLDNRQTSGVNETHPFNATLTIYSGNQCTEKHTKMYLNGCGLQSNLMHRFLEGMLIPEVIKIHAANGKQYYTDRITDRKTWQSNRRPFLVTKHGQKPPRTSAPGIVTIYM